MAIIYIIHIDCAFMNSFMKLLYVYSINMNPDFLHSGLETVCPLTITSHRLSDAINLSVWFLTCEVSADYNIHPEFEVSQIVHKSL